MNRQMCTDTYVGHKILCRGTPKFPPGHKQNREDIFILTKDTHMKTDTCAHKSHTYQERCSQGHAWAKGRCTHWHKHVPADTGTGMQKEYGDTEKNSWTHRKTTQEITGTAETGTLREGSMYRAKGRHLCTAMLTEADVQMVIHK